MEFDAFVRGYQDATAAAGLPGAEYGLFSFDVFDGNSNGTLELLQRTY